jgi:formate/nitrite transporter FocA (FNT family)
MDGRVALVMNFLRKELHGQKCTGCILCISIAIYSGIEHIVFMKRRIQKS